MDTTLDLDDLALLAILAATDAVFIPDRNPSARRAVKYERRSAPGVPWASEKALPGLDEAARKQVPRALDELSARDLVATFRPRAAKTLFVRLTDVGDERARAMAGLPRVENSLPLVEGIRRRMEGS